VEKQLLELGFSLNETPNAILRSLQPRARVVRRTGAKLKRVAKKAAIATGIA
jgi:hypothetical protein